jgi:hypothetical protein
MMSHVEQPAPSQSAAPETKPKYTTWDGRPKDYPSQTLPGIGETPILPVWLTSRLNKLFKRAPKEA